MFKNSFLIIALTTFSFCAQGIEVEYKKENVPPRGMRLEDNCLKLHHIFIIKDLTFSGTPYGLWSTIGDISHSRRKNKNKITKIWSAIKQKYGARPNNKIDYIEAKVDAQYWTKEEAYDLVIQTLNAIERAGYHNQPSADISDTNQAVRTEINFSLNKTCGKSIYGNYTVTCAKGDIDRFIGPQKPSYEERNNVGFIYYPLNDCMEQSYEAHISENPTHYWGPLSYPASPLQLIKEIKAVLSGKDLTIDPKPKNEVTK